MQHLEVGGYLNGKPEFIAEGVSIRYDDSGLTVLITYDNPTPKEIDNIKNGDLYTKIYCQDGIAFFLFQYGSLPWMDTPLNVITKTFDPVGENDRLAILTILADSRDGRIHVIRYTGLSTAFSRNINEVIAPTAKYNRSLSQMIQTKVRTDEMVRKAQFCDKD